MDYEFLRFIWWLLVGILLIGFAVTDGFDMGVGALLKAQGDVATAACGHTVDPIDGAVHCQGAIRRLRDGIELEDGVTAPAKVAQPTPGILRIVIHEGRNRQVRRMCEAIGHPVTRLVRTRIGPLSDRRLKPGEWRELTQPELRLLTEAVALVAQGYDSDHEQ